MSAPRQRNGGSDGTAALAKSAHILRWKDKLPSRLWLLAWPAIAVAVLLLAGAPNVYAHEGIEAGQSPWTAWNPNPLPTLLLFVAAYLYVTGLGRWQRPSHPVSAWQRISFFSGLLAIFLALQSPLDALAQHMLSFHQVQHFLLRMVAPLLLLLGAPLTPILRGLPSWALMGVVKPVVKNHWARGVYDLITNPVLTTVLFLGFLGFWQVPGPHNLALRNTLIHELMHFTMLSSGLLFYWLVIDPKPHRSRLHYGLRVLYQGLIIIPNTFLGAAITFAREPIYSGYADVEQPFNISLLTDQQLGGMLLWVPGDMMSILVAGVVMVMWYEKEEGEGSKGPGAVPSSEGKISRQ